MNKASKSLRLTDRDVEYITWIAEQQAVRLDTLQLLFEIKGRKIDPRALRRLVERWQRLGLVQKKILLAKAPSIIWPTIEGMKVANLPLSRGDRNYTPSFSSVHHTVAIFCFNFLVSSHYSPFLKRTPLITKTLPFGEICFCVFGFKEDLRESSHFSNSVVSHRKVRELMAIGAGREGS
jgi:hypothetical protein